MRTTPMRFPPQKPPVKRPELVEVSTCVDIEHGTPEQMVSIRMQLTHGANYNDPAPFAAPSEGQRKGSW